MQDEPLDLSKKASTDSVEDVKPVIPPRFASSQCGLSKPMEKSGWPTEQEMVKYTHSQEGSIETEDMAEEAAKDDKQNIVEENYDVMERRVNTSYEVPNPSSIPSQSESGSGDESTQLLERSSVRIKREKSLATQKFSRHFKKQKKDRPYKCEECDMVFDLRKNFESHAKTHPGYKPYKCQACDKAFNRQWPLDRHNNIHTGNKPYKCRECAKAYDDKFHLVLHESIHSEKKTYDCKECGMKFTLISNLKRYNDIHTGNKRHVCNLCNKVFSRKSDMERHTRIHTEVKPFKCTVCDTGFTRNDHLKKHEFTHEKS